MTRPSLPRLENVIPLLERIWESRQLTNLGPLLRQFEVELAEHLGVQHVSLVTNATMGLVLAMHQAKLTGGEVITTPFSFVATTHAIRQAGCVPVFADVDPDTLNLDPAKVEALITPKTRAILPVHVFGTPCDTDGFGNVAERHGLTLIYDAAHAFGVRDAKDQSILQHGDMSVLSFHATKVFNTFEGGAVLSHDLETKQAIDRLANFGLCDETAVDALGTNAKMNEFSAAVGLAQLAIVDELLRSRADRASRYQRELSNIDGIHCIARTGLAGHNHYAFPILIGPEYPLDRDALHDLLLSHNIHARRYFSPLISEMEAYCDLPSAHPDRLPIAKSAADKVLCLPLFPDLDNAVQDEIIGLVQRPCP